MTKQEVFDKVVRGLAAQQYQTSMSGGKCKYRGDGGRRCALGHIIPDHMYTEAMDQDGDQGFHDFSRAMESLNLPNTPMEGTALGGVGDLIVALRTAHDYDAPGWLPGRLLGIGQAHGLVWPSDVPAPQ